MGKGRKRNSRSFNSESVIRVNLQQLLTVTASTNVAVGKMADGNNWVAINTGGVSGGSTRFATLSDQFAYYRFVRLRHRLHPATASIAINIGLDSNETATAPSSNENVFSSGTSPLFVDGVQTVPSRWASVDCRKNSPLPWYKTGVTTVTALEELGSQFQWMAFTSGVSTAFNWEMEATVEFKGAIVAGLNPKPRGFPPLPGSVVDKHPAGCRCSGCLAASFVG